MEAAALAAVSEDLAYSEKRSARGFGVGLESFAVRWVLWFIRALPNGGLRANLLLGLLRVPGISRVEVHYLLENVPLTVTFQCRQLHYRLDLEESIFHFNSMVGWHLGLHRQDVEREDVHIVFGKLHLQRQSIPGRFEGFVLTRQ